MRAVAYFTLGISGVAAVILSVIMIAVAIIDPELVAHIEDVDYNQGCMALLLGGGFLTWFSFMCLYHIDEEGPVDNVA